MKKIINNPGNVVDEMLQGLVAAYPDRLELLAEPKVILRKEKKCGKVALISGGGSGHEPAHAGFVGKGMLDAAVAGNVFASPAPDQIQAAIAAADAGKGVLLVIKNYSGDVMNFTMAAELAEMDGVTADYVVVDDDVSISKQQQNAGRRGIVGTIFVHKIAGALAEEGAPLADVKAMAERVIQNTRSMGMALTPCIVPEAGAPSFTLADDEMELGMGIHGEAGVKRQRVLNAAETVSALLTPILDELNLSAGDEVAAIVNGLGATPLMELLIVNRELHRQLGEKSVVIGKTFVGNYMTALEMAGCSISILKLDADTKRLLHAAADTPALTV